MVCGEKMIRNFYDGKYHNLHQNRAQHCFIVLPGVVSGVLCIVYSCRILGFD